jgi:hypothetical protein
MALSPTSSRSSGGSSYTAPITRALYTGNAVTVANGANAYLTLNTKNSGTALLNISVPDTPTVVTAGVYAVTVEFQPQDVLTTGGHYNAHLGLDAGGDNPDVQVDSPVSTAASNAPQVCIAVTYYLPAGSEIAVRLWNYDGTASVPYAIGAFVIQRIS